MATLGQPAKYTCCFAENTHAPMAPLHVERGFDPSDSAVTVVGISGTVEVVDSVSQTAVDLGQTFAQSMLIAGNRGTPGLIGGGEPLLVIPPELAALFARDGYSKGAVKAAIFDRARFPLERLSVAVSRSCARLHRWRRGPDGRAARRPRRADDLMIVVAGGVGVKGMYAPTWGGGTRAVSRRIAVTT